MRHDARVLPTDIDQAGADIEHFTEGTDMDAFAADSMVQSAVERKFEIIGEALNCLHQNDPDLAERVHRPARDHRLPKPAGPWV